MALFLGSVTVLTVLAILLIALLEHALRPASLPGALRAQRVLPVALAWPVAGVVVATEAALVALGALGLARGEDGTALVRIVLAAGACLFVVYAAYSRYLVAARDGVPCGCAGDEMPVSQWVVGRAAVLAVLAIAGIPGAAQATALTADGGRFTVVLLAATSIAVALWHLPAAMEDPVQVIQRRERQRLLRRIRGGQVHEL